MSKPSPRPQRPPTVQALRHAAWTLHQALALEAAGIEQRYGRHDYGEARELRDQADGLLRVPSQIETTRARLT